MATKVVYYERQFQKEIRRLLVRRMIVGAKLLVKEVKENISIPTATHGPSRPGEMPHRDTGDLYRSIFWDQVPNKTDIVIIVGTPIDYGAIHELTERPFLLPTLVMMQRRIADTIYGKGSAKSGSFKTIKVH